MLFFLTFVCHSITLNVPQKARMSQLGHHYAKPSNIKSLQVLQTITLRLNTGAFWHATNLCLHKDLHTVRELAIKRYKNVRDELYFHPNPLIQNISSLTLTDNTISHQLRRDQSSAILLLSPAVGIVRQQGQPKIVCIKSN